MVLQGNQFQIRSNPPAWAAYQAGLGFFAAVFRARRLARAATLALSGSVESVRIEVLTQPFSNLGVAFDEVRVGVALAATDVADLALN